MWRRVRVVPGLFTILAPAIALLFARSIAPAARAQSDETTEPSKIDGRVVRRYPAGDLLEKVKDRFGLFGSGIFGKNAKDYLLRQLDMAGVSGSSSFFADSVIDAEWHGKELTVYGPPELHRHVERHLAMLRSSQFERLEASVRFVAIRPERLLALPVDWKIIPPPKLDVPLAVENDQRVAIEPSESTTLAPAMAAVSKEEVFSQAFESTGSLAPEGPREILSGETTCQIDFGFIEFIMAGRDGKSREVSLPRGTRIAYRPLLQENGRISLFVSQRAQSAEKAGRAFIGFDEQGDKRYVDVPKVNVTSLDVNVELAPGECVLLYACPVEAEAEQPDSLLKKAGRVVGLSRDPEDRESNRTILATLIKVDRAKE